MRGWIIRFLPFLVVVLLGLSMPLSRVLAAPTEVYWDFRTDQHGTAVIPWPGASTNPITEGTYTAGVGYQSATTVDYEPGFTATFLTVQLPNDDLFNNPITQVKIYGDGVRPGIAEPTFVTTISTFNFSDSGSTRGENENVYDVTGQDLHQAILYVDELGDNPSVITGIAFVYDCTEGCGGLGDLTMPLKSADLHPQWGMFDPTYVHSLDSEWPDTDSREPVYAYSNRLGASVHAVVPGTVTAVDSDITPQCTTLDQTGIPLSPHSCFVVLPKIISGKSVNQIFALQMSNTALVLVKSDSDPTTIFTYFVSNPNVSVGDHVEAGCIVGETIPLDNAEWHIGDIGAGASAGNSGASGNINIGFGLNETIRFGASVTIVRMDTLSPDIVRLYPSLTSEPDESQCASNFSGCLNGSSSSLLSLTEWTTSDGVTLLSGGGASLSGGSQIYQTNNMTLSDATTYTMTVQARSTTPGDGFNVVNRVRLFANQTVQEFPVTTTWEPFSISFLGEALGSGDAYGVVNRNASDVGIEIRYICISGEGASQTPNACYFKNHHFDDGPKDWTYDDGITFQSGQAFTYNDTILDQGVQLYPLTGGGDATYNLTVAGRLIATSSYTGQSGKYVDLSYRFPMSGEFTLVGEIDSAKVEAEGKNVYSGNLDLEHTYVLTVPITISSYTTGLFSIKTNVTDSDNYLKGFRIDYACLQSTTDDGGFPGQGGAGFNPPFYENCEVIAVPQDNNISSWTYYHWSNLNRFFNCTLMVKLNKMAELMDTAWKTTRLFLRWMVASGQMSGRWLSTQVFPWLNGHFRNIATGQVTTVYQSGGGQCSDLFCLLDNIVSSVFAPLTAVVNTLLSLLTAGANLLLTVVTGVIGLSLAFITRLLTFFNQASNLLSGLLNAYNTATPTAIEGLPMCNIDPTSSLFCRATWLFDNTIFSGRWGILFTLILGILGVHLILWVIGEFKNAIVTTGGTS